MELVTKALVIELERAINGLDTKMDGQGLYRALESCDSLAEQLDVDPPFDFWSEDPDRAGAIIDTCGGDSTNVMFPPLQLFPAEDGLRSFRALATYLRAHPESVPDASGVLRDLSDCERILEVARQHSVRWHFRQEF